MRIHFSASLVIFAISSAAKADEGYDMFESYDNTYQSTAQTKHYVAGAIFGAFAHSNDSSGTFPATCGQTFWSDIQPIEEELNHKLEFFKRNINPSPTGQQIALAGGEENYWELAKGWQAKAIAFQEGYNDLRTPNGDDGPANEHECRMFHAAAVNYGLARVQPMTDDVRNFLRMAAILENNNCFYDGHLAGGVEKNKAWSDGALIDYRFYNDVFNYEGMYDEIIYPAYTEGTTDGQMTTICPELEAYWTAYFAE